MIRLAIKLLALFAVSAAHAQSSTSAVIPTCDWEATEPQTEEERQEDAIRAFYRDRLAAFHALLPASPDETLDMPVAGIRVSQVTDTWGAPRGGGRAHEGQDIFAPRGTPVLAATDGWVYRIETRERGGKVVWVAGAGGMRYYYAHLDDWAEIAEGTFVTSGTVLGFVGNTGNALTTPPHLHFGIYSGSRRTCDRQVYDPLPLLVDR